MRRAVASFIGAAAAALFAGCSLTEAPTTQILGAQRVAPADTSDARATSYGSISNAAREPARLARARRASRSWFSSTVTKNVFLADAQNGVVDIFDFASRQQTGAIAGFTMPEGLATDSKANLYVADTLAQRIDIYAKPYVSHTTVLKDRGFYPAGVYVDARGNVYVANICSGSGDACSGNGDTVEYRVGSKIPQRLAGGPGRAYFTAMDSRGNLWVDGQFSAADPTAVIGYFSARTRTFVRVGIDFKFPGGIAFDGSGNLLLDDQSGAPNGASILNIYAPGATAPSDSIVLQTNGDDIVDIALGSAQSRLFAPDYFAGNADIITYPAGITVNELTPALFGELDAVAVAPETLP
jgi:hypothetical protein